MIPFNEGHKQHLKDFYTLDQLRSMGGDPFKGFSCFNPGHGGEDKSKGMKFYEGNQWAYCFKCEAGFDLFGMIGIEIRSDDFMKQYEAACEKFNDYPSGYSPGEEGPRKIAQEARKPEERGNIPEAAQNAVKRILEPQAGNPEEEARKRAAEEAKKAQNERERTISRQRGRAVIEEARKQIKNYPEAFEYIQKRGFSRKMAEAIGIGFLKDYPPNHKLDNRIIFPGREGYYIARTINDNDGREKYLKPYKLENEVYNLHLLEEAGTGPIFITEGEIDAMTIEHLCGFPSIGLAGTSNAKKVIEAGKKAKAAITGEAGKALIIIPDNDKNGKGQATAADLLKRLREEGIPALTVDITGECKDSNEAYVKDPEGFRNKLAEAYEKGYAFAMDPEAILKEEQAANLREYDKGTHTAIAEDFRAWAIERAAKPCIPTGFPLLDGQLNGGLREELYILGGIPSAGKTTFALQLADQMAEAGEDVLFFSLEQGKYELTSKSISRLTWEEATEQERKENLPRSNIAVIESLGYKGETEAEKKILGLVNRAMNRYKGFVGRIRIIEASGKLKPSDIGRDIKLHEEMTGNKPVVIVDYLQLISAENDKVIDTKPKVDQIVSDLARLCREYLTPVIAISSLNRDGYEKAGMANLKESGNLEYSAQVVILLGFRNPKGTTKDLDEWIDEESERNPRQVFLKIAKYKNGEKGKKIAFDYYTVHNRFKELEIMTKKK